MTASHDQGTRAPQTGPRTASAEQATVVPASRGAVLAATARRLWAWIRAWFAANTFTPRWVPEPWRHPLAGYLAAAAAQASAVLASIVLLRLYPDYSFLGVFEFLALVLVALSWGAGPSLLATVLGAVLLEYVIMVSQRALREIDHAGDLVEVSIFLLVGGLIGVMASRAETSRRQALAREADARAGELALQELARRTDEFLSLASHELRTPLASMQLAAQLGRRLAVREAAGSPSAFTGRIGELMEQIERQARLQNRLVNDLLEVSRIQSNTLELHRAPTHLRAIVMDAVQDVRLIWPTRTVTVQAEEDMTIDADADRIRQVVMNFCTNALKYSPPDRPVEVVLRREGALAHVSVRDEGPGLPSEQHARIWERFHRAPGIVVQHGTGSGLGLGLHICKTIVERHGGQVGLRSAPGHGSTFWFTLPLAR